MTKNAKDQTQKMIPLWGDALAIMAPPEPIPASVRRVRAVTNKLRKLQQEIIASHLNELKEDAGADQLSRTRRKLKAMQIIMAKKYAAGR
jgi:hypothetical protein